MVGFGREGDALIGGREDEEVRSYQGRKLGMMDVL